MWFKRKHNEYGCPMCGITDEQLEEWIARKTVRQSKRMQADDPFIEGEDVE